MSESVKRSYKSPLRQEQARATRRAIVGAAAQLFIERGYGATTVDAITQAALVSRNTFFSAVGTKAEALKLAVNWAITGDDEPVPLMERPHVRADLAEPDARQALRGFARNVRHIGGRIARLHAVMQAATGTDPEIASMFETSLSQRRNNTGVLAQSIRDRGALRSDLSVSEAADIIWLFNDPSLYHRLVLTQGWNEDRYEQWLASSLIALLIREDYELQKHQGPT